LLIAPPRDTMRKPPQNHTLPALRYHSQKSPAAGGAFTIRRPRSQCAKQTNCAAWLERRQNPPRRAARTSRLSKSWVSRRLRDDRAIRGAARAERAALLKRAGGAEKLGYPFVPGQTLEEHDRERRAAAFNLRPGTHDPSGCWGISF
jgi:hypothetical protein